MTDANKKILQIFSILQILEHARNKTPDLRYFQVMAFVQRDLSNMLGSVLKESNINLFKVIYICLPLSQVGDCNASLFE